MVTHALNIRSVLVQRILSSDAVVVERVRIGSCTPHRLLQSWRATGGKQEHR